MVPVRVPHICCYLWCSVQAWQHCSRARCSSARVRTITTVKCDIPHQHYALPLSYAHSTVTREKVLWLVQRRLKVVVLHMFYMYVCVLPLFRGILVEGYFKNGRNEGLLTYIGINTYFIGRIYALWDPYAS